MCVLTISYSLYKLTLKLFDMATLIYLSLISVSSIGCIIFILNDIRQLGLVRFLPDSIKKVLLERSLFDVLMDIWYMPSDMDKALELLIPFLNQYTPEQTQSYLNRLDNKYKSALTRRVMKVLN